MTSYAHSTTFSSPTPTNTTSGPSGERATLARMATEDHWLDSLRDAWTDNDLMRLHRMISMMDTLIIRRAERGDGSVTEIFLDALDWYGQRVGLRVGRFEN